MASKNFTAAEKYFLKKQEKYEKEILELRQARSATDHKIFDLLNENRELKASNELLKDWNDRLLEYMDMTDEDRKQVLKKDKELSEFYQLIRGLGLLI